MRAKLPSHMTSTAWQTSKTTTHAGVTHHHSHKRTVIEGMSLLQQTMPSLPEHAPDHLQGVLRVWLIAPTRIGCLPALAEAVIHSAQDASARRCAKVRDLWTTRHDLLETLDLS